LARGAEAWVTAADDMKGIVTVEGAARRLASVNDTGQIRLNNDALITFKLKTKNGIASPFKRNNPGFVPGGLTGGGAREWVIDSNSEIEIVDVKQLK
jgi:hypothetical protein